MRLLVLLCVLLAVPTGSGCGDGKGCDGDGGDPSPTVDVFDQLARPVWGKNFLGLGGVTPPGSGAPGELLLVLKSGHPCTPGALRRYILEAARPLLEWKIDRVHCGEELGKQSAPPVSESVSPYVKSVAEAVGYTYEEWIAKPFHFSGEVHGPTEPRILPEERFTDRFAFVDFILATVALGYDAVVYFDMERSNYRADKTTWVIHDRECDIMGWRTMFFESHHGRGRDFAYFWTRDGGGRFVVCEGRVKRFLLGVPRSLAEIGLAGVSSYQQCWGGVRCN